MSETILSATMAQLWSPSSEFMSYGSRMRVNRVVDLGGLYFPSGTVCAFDALVPARAQRPTARLPVGLYRVQVSIVAHAQGSDPAPAIGAVRLGAAHGSRVAEWRRSVGPGSDGSVLGICDASVYDAVGGDLPYETLDVTPNFKEQRTASARARASADASCSVDPEVWWNAIVVSTVRSGVPASFVAFTSGGDGGYPLYWGRTRAGKVSELCCVTSPIDGWRRRR